jgi:ribokinase
LPKQIYESLHIVVVNEHEARDVTGKADLKESVQHLHRLGCKNVVVTLGSKGVMFSEGETLVFIEALKVQALDTTGAGDCFVGWLGAGVAEGLSLAAAIERACKAAALKVTREGAQSGMPYRHEVLSDGK